DIFGAAPISTATTPCRLPSSSSWLTQLIHKPAHSDVHYHPQRQEHEQHGRPTVTHQRQRYSGDRHKTNNHADIDQDMEAKHSHHTHHHERPSAVGRCLRVLGQTHQHYEVYQQNPKSAYESMFLGKRRENEIRLRNWE